MARATTTAKIDTPSPQPASVRVKHEQIFRQIKDRIIRGELRPGEALPSQAALMRDHGVALGTVRQALNRLQAEGWICAQRGKGSFVRPRSAPRKIESSSAVVGVAVFDESGAAQYEHLMAIRTVLAKADIELLVGIFSPSQVNDALEWAQSLTGVMTWARPPIEFMQRIVSSGTPTILVGNMHEGECPPEISHVNFNLHGAVDQAIQMLGSMGHQRILFVNRGGRDAEPYIEFSHRLSQLFDEVVRNRITDPVHHELALDVGETPRLIEYLNSADPPPTAMFIEGGQRACGLLHELEKAKWSAPGQISAIAISPLQPRVLANPNLTYVELPTVELATRSAAVMIELLRDRRLIRESISPILHWGNTCRKVSDDAPPEASPETSPDEPPSDRAPHDA